MNKETGTPPESHNRLANSEHSESLLHLTMTSLRRRKKWAVSHNSHAAQLPRLDAEFSNSKMSMKFSLFQSKNEPEGVR